MKHLLSFVLLAILLTAFSACSDDKEEEVVYKIVNKHIKLYPYREAILNSAGDYMYLSNSHSEEPTFIIHLSGYFMHGIVGKVHGLDSSVYDCEIPYNGFDAIISGVAKVSTEGASLIPEELGIDFYCTSIIFDPDGNDTYSFKKIEFNYTNESKKEEISTDLRSATYYNRTSVQQKYVYAPLDKYYEFSQFFSDDREAFSVLIQDVIVSVPAYIDNQNNISLGEKKWPYSNQQIQRESGLNLNSEFEIPPMKALQINAKLISQKYTTNYKLTLINNKTKREKIVEGRWEGMFPMNIKVETTFTDL